MATSDRRRLPSPIGDAQPGAGTRPRPTPPPRMPEAGSGDTAPGAALDYAALDAARRQRYGREELPLRDDSAEYMARSGGVKTEGATGT
ncbi:hypothetical protein [Streptomonospora halophila]